VIVSLNRPQPQPFSWLPALQPRTSYQNRCWSQWLKHRRWIADQTHSQSDLLKLFIQSLTHLFQPCPILVLWVILSPACRGVASGHQSLSLPPPSLSHSLSLCLCGIMLIDSDQDWMWLHCIAAFIDFTITQNGFSLPNTSVRKLLNMFLSWFRKEASSHYKPADRGFMPGWYFPLPYYGLIWPIWTH
jgi:hypothetical protein